MSEPQQLVVIFIFKVSVDSQWLDLSSHDINKLLIVVVLTKLRDMIHGSVSKRNCLLLWQSSL